MHLTRGYAVPGCTACADRSRVKELEEKLDKIRSAIASRYTDHSNPEITLSRILEIL
jgi:hypothetical protein